MRWSVLAAALLGAGCTVHLSLADLDRLQADMGVASVSRKGDFTLWSPLQSDQSEAWVRLIERAKGAVDAAFGLQPDPERRLQVVLEELPGLGLSISVTDDQVHIQPPGPHPRHGVAGHALDDRIVIYIAPATRFTLSDGHTVIGLEAPEDYLGVLLHELAHVASARAGIEGQAWLREGLADHVESLELTPQGLLDGGPPQGLLRSVAALEPAQRDLARLFDWREDGAAIAQGREAVDRPSRLLAGLFVRWQVAAEPGAPTAGLDRRLTILAGRPRAELLAEEPLWQAWLDEQIALAVAAAPPAPAEGPPEEPSDAPRTP